MRSVTRLVLSLTHFDIIKSLVDLSYFLTLHLHTLTVLSGFIHQQLFLNLDFRMAANSINYATKYSSIVFNPTVMILPEKDPNWFQKCLHSKYFKNLKKCLFVIFVLNLMGWGNMLLFISVGAANRTMPDERTRKMWIEIGFQVINGLLFIMIAGHTPWRIRDLYQFYREKHRPTLLQRHKYTNNLVLLQFILWSLIVNSIFQVAVSICMWSMNMHKRPMWSVNVFGGLSLVSGVFAGLTQFILERIAKKKAKRQQQSTGMA